MAKYQKEGNRTAAKLEREKMKSMRKEHGIYASISLLNLCQFPLHIAWVAVVNKMAFNYHIAP